MSSERLRDPPVRRSLVGAGIVALWGALLASLGAPLLGLVLAGIAALICIGVLVAGYRPRLPSGAGCPRLESTAWCTRIRR